MEIQRTITKQLIEWKNRHDRRPLIVRGARQIGKTWVIKKFGESHFKYMAYFNFDSNEELCREFEKTKDVGRLIKILGIYCDVPILPEETLIFFDEIQECASALNSLKYFCEDAPRYAVACAGSLLGISLKNTQGFPVGKVDFLDMYPVSFEEYFNAEIGRFAEIVDTCRDFKDFSQLPEIIISGLTESFRKYRVCGGMPKATVASLENMGNDEISREQNELLLSFFHDFSKHAPKSDVPRISYIWDSLPSQLAKENRKFIYKVVRPGARAREYESAVNWLREAGLIYQIYCSSKPELPLAAYDDLSAFKIYMLDCGLLRALAKMPPELFYTNNLHFVEFKGALAENLVLQQFLASSLPMPRYWMSGGKAEIDFLLQSGLEIIPIEVKAGENTAGKSLGVYIGKYKPQKAVILSEKPLSRTPGETEIFHLPLYLSSWANRIVPL